MPQAKDLFLLRVVTLLLIGIAAAAVLLFLGPPNAVELRAAASNSYRVNSRDAENVYQQQVAALWGVKDLQEVLSQQASDQRPVILLFLGIASICVIGITSPPSARSPGIVTELQTADPRAKEPEKAMPIRQARPTHPQAPWEGSTSDAGKQASTASTSTAPPDSSGFGMPNPAGQRRPPGWS